MTTSFLDVLDPAARADPYRVYRRILDEAPVSEAPAGLFAFARHSDCAALLRDPRVSSDDRNSAVYQALLARGRISADQQQLMASQPFLFRDPPDHTRLRRLVGKAFGPREVEGLEARIEGLVDDLLDAAAGQGRFDALADLAAPLPIAVICDLLGIPREDAKRFADWSQEMARSLDPLFTLSEQDRARQAEAGAELRAYLNELIDRRRAKLGHDLLSALLTVRERGEQLTRSDLVATVMLLLIAGHETTVNLVANGVLALLRHPAALAALRADPGLATAAVEEVLRYDPPVQFRTRVAAEDLPLGGVVVPRGASIVVLLGAANRDPARFAAPDRFDLNRPDNRHLAFGAGIHFCLGAPLARLEGRIALAAFAGRVVRPYLLGDEPPYLPGASLRGLAGLPVGFDAMLCRDFAVA